MQQGEYTEGNRLAWNEAEPYHRRKAFDQWRARFRQPGYSCLDATLTATLQGIGLAGKDAVQLGCNNGRELLSLWNLGAGRCVGFDISDAFIGQARELAALARLPVEFVRGDIYQVPPAYYGSFDLALVTVGVLGWMPDLAGLFGIAARLLRPGGWLVVYEMHPALDLFEADDHGDPPTLAHSYFRTEPYVDEDGLDYVGGERYAARPTHWFHHTVSDIVEGCLGAGLTLRGFREHTHDLSEVFAHFERLRVRPPLSFTLLAQRSDGRR
ncbi:MAG: class I SAM-dependent methyltransferase [Chloroflexi bacterium]|nr:class I SAM-dependent methyltransferase [Chloroflexota bacterium]